jgi:acetyl-CoA carboxylase carboxyltransferase component
MEPLGTASSRTPLFPAVGSVQSAALAQSLWKPYTVTLGATSLWGDHVSASVLKSTANLKSPEFEKNSRRIVDLLTKIKNEEERIFAGGGAKAIESQHKKGRLTARDRITKLIDPGSHLFELGTYAAYEMYEEWGGAPCAGAVTGLAKICGRTFMVIANDATVKAGAFFPMTAKKVIRAQNIAIENHIPTIYLVDSAGVFLPLLEDVFDASFAITR